MKQTPKEFLKAYNISEQDFKTTDLVWKDLVKIHDAYEGIHKSYEPTAKLIAELLVDVPNVHSVKYRVKNPGHLIAKIIRKKIDTPTDGAITVDDYRERITDIIGVRALHLFKDDWKGIHEYIMKHWQPKEVPVANVRKGDFEDEFVAQKCEIKIHKYGYRSVHYLIESKPAAETFKVEIQVRTIFEEGWSEIDHKVRYPYHQDNQVLSGYLNMFNGIAGSADVMGSFLKVLHRELEGKESRIKEGETKIRELKEIIDRLEINKKDKERLGSGLDQLGNIGIFNRGGGAMVGLAAPNFMFEGGINPMLGGSLGGASLFMVGMQSRCVKCGKLYTEPGTMASFGLCEDCRHNPLVVTVTKG